MNSISVMREEIESQVTELPYLSIRKRHGNAIMIGSGDSYAACMLSAYLSKGRIQYSHPTEILAGYVPTSANILNTSMPAYFVSISGRTRANIMAARSLRRQGHHIAAITADKASPLAKTCNESIILKIKQTNILTSGTLSFTTALIACCSVAGLDSRPKSMRKLFTQAEKDALASVRSATKGHTNTRSIIFLGKSIMYPIAMYAAMKINEVLGVKAFYYDIDEFCHSPIFSISRADLIVLLNCNNQGETIALKINQFLKRPVLHIDCTGSSPLEISLGAIFFAQLFALCLAEKRNLKECYFLTNRKLLSASSDLIY